MRRARRFTCSTAGLILLLAACSSANALDAPVSVGVMTDAPSVAYQDPLTNQRSGFDVDLYRWIGDNSSPKFLPTEIDVNIENRETVLRERRVSFIVSSYSIADFREPLIDFAGPYLTTQQGVMMRKGDNLTIRGPQDLVGKNVCAQLGSTSARQLKAIRGVIVTELVGLGECVKRLSEGYVQVVSTDQLLLQGYARRDPLLEVPIAVRFGALERWGIGLQPEDGDKNCKLLNEKIRSFIISKVWDTAFLANFGDIDPAPYRPDPNNLRECVIDKEDP
ncbi:MAG: transporter substrate-binding domain-containing protein [Pseudonocardiaceae bacterium]